MKDPSQRIKLSAVKASDGDRYHVTMLVGNGTYNGVYFPTDEIAPAAASMVGRPVNIDHSESIADIVGHVVDAKWNGRALVGVIQLNPAAAKYAVAKAFLDGGLAAGATPNVSVEVYRMLARETLSGVERNVARKLRFAALSLVDIGACDDHAGCGVNAATLRKVNPMPEDNVPSTPPASAETKETLCAVKEQLAATTVERDALAVDVKAKSERLAKLEADFARVTGELDTIKLAQARAPLLAKLAALGIDAAPLANESPERLALRVETAEAVAKLAHSRAPAEPVGSQRKTNLAADAAQFVDPIKNEQERLRALLPKRA